MTPRKIILASAAALALMSVAVSPVAAQQRFVGHRASVAIRLIDQPRIAEPAQYRPVPVILGVDY